MTVRADVATVGAADRMQADTAELHRVAERTGVIADLLRGAADRDAYALLLRNLLPVYAALERALDRAVVDGAAVAVLAWRELYRAGPIERDITHLGGDTSTPLPATLRYVARIEHAARATAPGRLAAHCYVRYLGDLNGGQILKRLLARRLGLGPECLATYDFPEDPATLAPAYRHAIDAALSGSDLEAAVEEASAAFELTIALSDEVRRESRSARPEPTASEDVGGGLCLQPMP